MTYSMRLLTRNYKPGAVALSDVHASTWYADGRVFNDQVRQHSFVEIGHEILSTAFLCLPLIQLLTTGTGYPLAMAIVIDWKKHNSTNRPGFAKKKKKKDIKTSKVLS